MGSILCSCLITTVALSSLGAAFRLHAQDVRPRTRRPAPLGRTSLRMGTLERYDDGGLKYVVLKDGDVEATIYDLGACVTSFKAPRELLFVRPDAKMDGSKPISGGLPFCWPQFGPGKLQQHGFARNLEWALLTPPGGVDNSVQYVLRDSDATRKMWPHHFRLLSTVSIDPKTRSLSSRLEVFNTGTEPLEFTGAIHSYYAVPSVDSTEVVFEGLLFPSGVEFIDRTQTPAQRGKMKMEDGGFRFTEETDTVLPKPLHTQGVVKLVSSHAPVTTVIQSSGGWEDVCLWNPYGDAKMGADSFVCVESAKVTEPVVVPAGGHWEGKVTVMDG
uniref:glucose-6-phosphate 1-epimerase n=1 Tax=Chromera velia CCMP2878 TaxID=1169474 RepID=A0A0G4HKZ2_9ALVE|eukprot:Cvel_7357.t1-p1 / transcript=Cvel_7357.t1 / gene=Cvel_7357 / organism=Chromera_velia_CCMP2878 / gene_product=Putative glucose-6-phosphate 1-epimerase, putative / transcript_product=Putative glucose-6-phosphate 1-epimerase, putative / location=Cvel_scaffold382:19484-20915(-) / protein_length=329 / sequence_SO=supercontig / SO=protein_coding / is_pseudo=false